MRVEHNHAHADTRYADIALIDYHRIVKNMIEFKRHNYKSLNVHIPFELQHPSHYSTLKRMHAHLYIFFAEVLKRILRIPLYWENAPMLVYGTWNLARGQTDWKHVPRYIQLCLDTGHLMLGSTSAEEARRRIHEILHARGSQIRHLHIHENDLEHDKHWHEWKIITPDLMSLLQKGRSFIYEKGE